MNRHLPLLVLCVALAGCDKEPAKPAASPTSKLLGERLIAQHGEGVLASPIIVVYDTGFMVGRGSLDAEFDRKVEALGVAVASRLSAGASPVHTTEYFADGGVEFATAATDNTVVLDSTSSLTIRLLLGQAGMDALRTCEAVQLDRVCKGNEQLRARLDDIGARGATLVDGSVVSKASFRDGWAIFEDVPKLSDEVQLEVELDGGVFCNLSKWLIDPRDSCVL